MRSATLAALGLLLFCAIAAADDSSAAAPFAGVWEGKYKDTVYCVLKVTPGDSISGSMSVGQIDTEEDGELKSAGPASGDEHPLVKAHVEDGKLLFGWNDDANEQPIDFELKITGPGQAELRFLSTPPGVKIKPLKLEKKG